MTTLVLTTGVLTLLYSSMAISAQKKHEKNVLMKATAVLFFIFVLSFTCCTLNFFSSTNIYYKYTILKKNNLYYSTRYKCKKVKFDSDFCSKDGEWIDKNLNNIFKQIKK